MPWNCEGGSFICSKKHNSFIHYGDLYSAPSKLLLRSAPDPCTAKEKSFEARVECSPSPLLSLSFINITYPSRSSLLARIDSLALDSAKPIISGFSLSTVNSQFDYLIYMFTTILVFT